MSCQPGYTNTVICPYNKCHVILRERFQTHLIKCRRQHPDTELQICPFDQTHHVQELDAHVKVCPSRGIFDLHLYNVNGSSSSRDDRAPAQSRPQTTRRDNQTTNDDEDWDNENYGTYDAQKHAEGSKVLRNSGLLTKSERRKFRDEERKRLSALERDGQ